MDVHVALACRFEYTWTRSMHFGHTIYEFLVHLLATCMHMQCICSIYAVSINLTAVYQCAEAAAAV